MQIFSLVCEIANSWRFILFYLILLLGHFIAEPIYCRNTLLLGYFLQKHLSARSFSAETFYCWVISYKMLFNCADVSAVGIVYGSFLSISIQAQGIKYSEFFGSSLIAFGSCIKPIVEFRFRPPTHPKSHLSERKLFRPRQFHCTHLLRVGTNSVSYQNLYFTHMNFNSLIKVNPRSFKKCSCGSLFENQTQNTKLQPHMLAKYNF